MAGRAPAGKSATKARAPADLAALLARGGRSRIDLLRHCVRSITLEPVFVYLCGEYRLRATREAALALYDVFLAPGAPGAVKLPKRAAPIDPQFAPAITRVRAQAQASMPPSRPPAPPPHFLFDAIARAVQTDRRGGWARVAKRYDPCRTPDENLPGGTLTFAQRRFIDGVWRPHARERLLAAGYWRIADIE